MSIKLALIDNDQAVRANADLFQNGQDDLFGAFRRKIKEELVPIRFFASFVLIIEYIDISKTY